MTPSPGADPGFSVGGAPTYHFVKFSEKMHEIETILDRRVGCYVDGESLSVTVSAIKIKGAANQRYGDGKEVVRCEQTFNGDVDGTCKRYLNCDINTLHFLPRHYI